MEKKTHYSQTCDVCSLSHYCSNCSAIACDNNSQTVPFYWNDAMFKEDCRCNAGYSQRNEAERGKDSVIFDNKCLLCSPGYFNSELKSTQCLACPSGYFSSVIGSLSITDCKMCPSNWYSPTREEMCTQCQNNSHAPPGSGIYSNCICNAGFTSTNGDTCVACEAGKNKNTIGSSSCIQFKIGEYSTQTAATFNVCQECLSNSNSPLASDNNTSCSRNIGCWSGPNWGICFQCQAGEYKTEIGTSSCILCSPGKYSLTYGATNNIVWTVYQIQTH